MPINKIPNPVIIKPVCLNFSFLQNKNIPAPIPTDNGAKLLGLKIPSHSTLEINQLVTVVPIFAPIIIPTVCDKFINPAFTNPTVITVTAVLL